MSDYPDLPGRYLRKKRPGLQDPTMTHVDDPHTFHVGDYVRSYGGWSIIVAIRDEMFGDPDTRFAYLERCEAPTRGRTHDLRPRDVDTFYHHALLVNSDGTHQPISDVMTREEAGHAYEAALARACRGAS